MLKRFNIYEHLKCSSMGCILLKFLCKNSILMHLEGNQEDNYWKWFK
jgi:hypothetical protein